MILLGELESKRTIYFQKAAQHLNLSVQVLPYCNKTSAEDTLDKWYPIININKVLTTYKKKESFLSLINKPLYCKIDPPSYRFLNEKQYQIDSMYQACRSYHSWLSTCPAPSKNLHYLNTPKSLALLLDKYQCKKQLIHMGQMVTPLLGKNIRSYQELKQKMKDWHCNSVFIKPRLASGAAGILAYRYHPSTGQEVLYTSAFIKVLEFNKDKEQIINTKKLFCYREKEQIEKIFQKILPLGTIIERCIPKPIYKHYSYDLRILYQFGKIAFITVRQSNGPITNLHLNNCPLISEQLGTLPECLGLTKKQIFNMEQLCHKAVSAFDGLSMAGIDILFEKHSGKPMIIEMNGQGDLLYQDIYNENIIYKQQVEMIKAIEERKC